MTTPATELNKNRSFRQYYGAAALPISSPEAEKSFAPAATCEKVSQRQIQRSIPRAATQALALPRLPMLRVLTVLKDQNAFQEPKSIETKRQ